MGHSAEMQEASRFRQQKLWGGGCGRNFGVKDSETGSHWDEAVPLYQKPPGSDVRTPVATASVTHGNGRATIDASIPQAAMS